MNLNKSILLGLLPILAMLFGRGYVTCPHPSPSRASILTGHSPVCTIGTKVVVYGSSAVSSSATTKLLEEAGLTVVGGGFSDFESLDNAQIDAREAALDGATCAVLDWSLNPIATQSNAYRYISLLRVLEKRNIPLVILANESTTQHLIAGRLGSVPTVSRGRALDPAHPILAGISLSGNNTFVYGSSGQGNYGRITRSLFPELGGMTAIVENADNGDVLVAVSEGDAIFKLDAAPKSASTSSMIVIISGKTYPKEVTGVDAELSKLVLNAVQWAAGRYVAPSPSSASTSCPEPPSDPFRRLPLSSLSIFNAQNAYPVMYESRNTSEMGALYMPYEDWRNDVAPFHGIRGKVLDEEMTGRERVRKYFERFKKEFPEKLVMADYNGWVINPNSPYEIMKAFSAGHWLYFVGSGSKSDIPAQADDTEIFVDDISRFRIHLKGGEWYDDIVIYRLRDDGAADWEYSEQVKLLKINTEKSSITVKRGRYYTSPRAFEAGKTMLRAHMAVYPMGGTSQPLRWYYNLSDQCPRDRDGKQASEVWANQLADYFEPGAPLDFCDGIQFDVSFSRITQDETHAIAPRGVDVNLDNIPDHGWIDGINTFVGGSKKFYETLRRRLGPDRLITGDGVRPDNQRNFTIANGMESEGFQDLQLNLFWFSDIMNLNRVWKHFTALPAFTYLNQRYTVVNDNKAIDRIGMAAAQMLDIPITFESDALPKGKVYRDKGFTIPVWDEMIQGVEGIQGWLGKPLDGPVNPARKTPDALNGTGVNIKSDFLTRCVPLTENRETIQVDANAFTSSEYKNENLSYQVRMPVTDHENSYFRFDMNSLSDNADEIEKIVMRLNFVLVPVSGNATHTLNFYRVDDSGWDENKITFKNAPAHRPVPFASVKVNRDVLYTWLELDVTDFMSEPGKYTVYVEHGETIRYGFASRFHEDDMLHPHLRVIYRNSVISKTSQTARMENNNLYTSTAVLSADNGWLKIEKTEKPSEVLPNHLRFYIRNVPVDGQNLTVFATFKSAPMMNYPDNIGRVVHARIIEANGDVMKKTFTYSQPEELEHIFYFENIRSKEVTLEFRVEGTEDFYLKNLTAHSHPDVMYREFENGLVLLNPDMTKPYTFDLNALFPGQVFYKIKGTQDPVVNDGSMVNSVTLQPYDGLFLKKIK